ncbi:MAG: type II secretion system ATPase GspE [Deltaproteobacteria bacterium]|nr:type II secretion system ATPase GspE [Deltaproteobacteria bacterium]
MLLKKDNIDDSDLTAAFAEKLPLSFVKKNLVLPLHASADGLLVAIADPASLHALDEVRRAFNMKVVPVLVPAGEVLDAIHRIYERPSGTAERVAEEISEESLEAVARQWEGPRDLLELVDEAPVIRLLNSLLFQAVKEKASDVHIEPYERELEVRFRRDGVLSHVISPPKAVQDSLVSRVKIMSGLDIAEKRLPQDGRIRLLVAGNDIDARVSTVPTSFGERVVIRLLDRKGGLVRLSELGLSKPQEASVEALLTRSTGIILSTGPTGSGKTTTLYAALNRININERNVITVEDPVEYQLKGVGQIQVNSKIGLTFASGLRSVLRQDPDVIMVGEIRDPETAAMAIQASLTGHLVLSTLHTNDAPTAVTRLVDMGVEPFLLSSSLLAVIGQRLVRVLCPSCREEHPLSPSEKALFKAGAPSSLWKAKGCPKCMGTGYRGQTGIFEFMHIDPEMRALLLKSVDASTIREHAISKGMTTLNEDGLRKAAQGITSLEEVIRVSMGD